MEQGPHDDSGTEYEREQAARAGFPWLGEVRPQPPPLDDPTDPASGEDGETLQARPPHIWVGSLADYNQGNLYGKWLDASQDVARLQEEIVALLAEAPTPGAEEWAIFDYDGFGATR